MLIVAVLLINLLIAIFSNVFTVVEAQSTQFWKTTMYYLLVEYKAKPVVPAPFSVLQALLEGVIYLLRVFCKICRNFSWCKRSYTLTDKASKEGEDNDVAVEGGSETGACVQDGERWDDLEEEARDEETEELENSITQMERWTLRQILKQQVCEDANQISKIYSL
ncbi:unnamed protein product [Hydatigera taeniaeformis]|uniref:Ion_trans domain-containing protein n=1 Tax=Hydatigena taeniaeformis TaxID=6205 RepID=A0A0R3WXE4_HYDTA|nr:unnamed protein product [Hydatigera taeniaeformis]